MGISMAKETERFEQALREKKVPVLTLDNKWHKLFNQAEATKEIKSLEASLNDLVKRQGKVTTESKDLRKIKTNLMNEIVANMEAVDSGSDKLAEKKVEESHRLIDEINEKLDAYQDEMLELPRQIDEVNRKLMLCTMEQCYDVILENTEDIRQISEWIKTIRVELKKNVVRKQEKEIKNVELYSYMHDIFGPDVVSLFDIQYDIEGKKQEILNKQRAAKAFKEEGSKK